MNSHPIADPEFDSYQPPKLPTSPRDQAEGGLVECFRLVLGIAVVVFSALIAFVAICLPLSFVGLSVTEGGFDESLPLDLPWIAGITASLVAGTFAALVFRWKS